MSDSTCPANALVVVTSGAEAKFFRNDGTATEIKLSDAGGLTPKDLADDGPSGSQPSEASARDTDEATFAKQLAHHLYAQAHKGKFEHLVLVADPATLGEIRPLLHLEVTNRITMELNKTLTNSPTHDIERSLSAA
ncbi:protein required for attachment to host cells [Hoeflea marina]|uniref:Protein required for attachment to host cells n=1 Tax=Hoeflea marina TaxID=274592 RepID=A0A317PGU9_9HYPH|nr:host attachment family protein [Hoeflea marina]PWV99848.1 protein required for attachment to host cells [Hoeflea marina]